MEIGLNEFSGVKLIKSENFSDSRGIVSGINLSKIGEIDTKLQSLLYVKNSAKFTLRGLHFQSYPYEQKKVLKCVKGRVYDVFVDLRETSNTFLKWGYTILDAKNPFILILPEGFAHGYLTLERNTELIYGISKQLVESSNKTIAYNDEQLKINWPHEPKKISLNDLNAESLEEILKNEQKR